MKKREMQLGVGGEQGIYVAVWQMSARKNQDDIFAVARQLEMRSQCMFGREHGHALYFLLLGISLLAMRDSSDDSMSGISETTPTAFLEEQLLHRKDIRKTAKKILEYDEQNMMFLF